MQNKKIFNFNSAFDVNFSPTKIKKFPSVQKIKTIRPGPPNSQKVLLTSALVRFAYLAPKS